MKACVFVCVAEAWLPREVQEMQENLSRQDRQLVRAGLSRDAANFTGLVLGCMETKCYK